MNKSRDIAGVRFGRLTAVKIDRYYAKPCGRKSEIWLCKCDCGNEKLVKKPNLLSGDTKSCGCYYKETPKHQTHNKTHTRVFKIWQKIKERCLSQNANNYKLYGGRGITICKDWENNFMNFYNWAIKNGYKDNLSIDRIDVNGNYNPDNCRWTTAKEQARNRRSNRLITIKNKTHLLADWLELTNVSKSTFYRKLKVGLTPQEIFLASLP